MLIITFYAKEQELTHPTIVNYLNATQLSKEFVSILRCKKKKEPSIYLKITLEWKGKIFYNLRLRV